MQAADETAGAVAGVERRAGRGKVQATELPASRAGGVCREAHRLQRDAQHSELAWGGRGVGVGWERVSTSCIKPGPMLRINKYQWEGGGREGGGNGSPSTERRVPEAKRTSTPCSMCRVPPASTSTLVVTVYGDLGWEGGKGWMRRRGEGKLKARVHDERTKMARPRPCGVCMRGGGMYACRAAAAKPRLMGRDSDPDRGAPRMRAPHGGDRSGCRKEEVAKRWGGGGAAAGWTGAQGAAAGRPKHAS